MAAVAVEVPDAKKLPPGFRFHPSDEEIVAYYLKNKVFGKKAETEVIREIDLYKSEPWDLPEKSILPTRDPEWYFFCPRDKKYPNGSRSNRATEKGYWKATGKDRKVKSQLNKIGMKKTLVFYEGRAPHGQRTDWLMHEYRLDETQCNGTPHLQELYVVCRVFKKDKQLSKNVEQYGTSDEFDLSPSKSNLSPTKVNSVGEIEEQSEERPSHLTQEDENQATSGLRSETSSEIIDNKAEDNTCFDGPMGDLQGMSNQDYSSLSHNGTFVNENADIELGTEESPFESPWQMWELEDLPEFANSFFFDDKAFPSGDVLGGGYIKELDDYLQSIKEPYNEEPCFEEANDGMPDNVIDLQFRTRSSPWQSHQQPLPSQGTAIRRIRLQIHKTDESEDWNEQHGLTGHCQLECHDCNTDDSETVTQMEGSALASLPRQTSPLEEDDADSGFVYDSSKASERVTNDHILTAAPAQTLVSGLSTGESLERNKNSLNAIGSEEKSILRGTLDFLRSSDYGQSSPGYFGPLIETIQDNSERPQEPCNKSVGNGVSISVIRGQDLIEKSELVEKCKVIESESNSEVPNQVPEFSDSLPKGEKLVSHGSSSTGLQPVSEVSSTSAKVMKLGNEGMKHSATSFKKGNLAFDTLARFTSLQGRSISSHSTGIEDTGISCEGSVKHAGFNLILYGLKLRRKPRTKDIVFDGEEKSMDLLKSFSYHCSKEDAHTFVNLWKAYGIFKWLFKFQSKFSKGSNGISLLNGLLGIAILVVFIRVIWLLARSSLPIIF